MTKKESTNQEGRNEVNQGKGKRLKEGIKGTREETKGEKGPG